MNNRARTLKESLESLLNSDSREVRKADETTRVSRKNLRQALLDELSDAGCETKNHTHSKDRVVVDPAVENLMNLAAKIERDRDMEAQQGVGDALTMRPAGDSGSLNSSFKYLEG
ncbi:hypothetical protein [Nocardia cyriacigeorgica]|uniref:hypothetical protein n=1 Tax=Nocardia cyriacigeorgica TaxID=135487 RepID=UPI002455E6E6|nr:hypothetical protein [Nocardia cyriacigeorgica]